ncbi:MAG: 3-keto-5-aminohexanoate cleavage protein [Paracoccaceae bacterium]
MGKTIITCAITGGIHTPTMSDALPVTPDAIFEQARDAANAGATILHLHARNPQDGAPSGEVAHFESYLPRLKGETNAVLNLTTGGAPTMSVEERLKAALHFSPEMCSINMGSMNFALHTLADRYEAYKEAWEEPYLRSTEDNVFRNTFADIRQIAGLLSGEEHRIRFEHECYDVGHLYNLKFCIDQGFFKGPVFLQFVMGVTGGIGADIDNLVFMKKTADKLLGENFQWSVLAAGGQQMKLAAVAAQMGGHVRVGLEDSLYIERGVLATSNAQQVKKIREILEQQGNSVASPDEARALLGLKGADQTCV